MIVLGDFLSANKQTPDFKTHKKALTKESGFELNNKKSHFLVVERAELYSKGQKKALTVPNLRKSPKHSCHIRDLVLFTCPTFKFLNSKWVGGENQTDRMLGFNAKQRGKFFTKVEKRPKIYIFGPA